MGKEEIDDSFVSAKDRLFPCVNAYRTDSKAGIGLTIAQIDRSPVSLAFSRAQSAGIVIHKSDYSLITLFTL